MEDLDFNIAVDIASRVGRDSFIDLGGMLATSKFYRTLASTNRVLREVSLEFLFSNPHLINRHSPYRHFFNRCLDAGNPTAFYLESLKLAAKEGEAELALQMLMAIPNLLPHASFATGLLQVCLGYFEEAIVTVDKFVIEVGSFHAADEIGSSVFRQIMQIGPVKVRSHTDTWRYPDIPKCRSCNLSNRCPKCFFYWFTVMYLLLC